MIVLPAAGKLSLEEACSGLRYFLAALTLGSFYGYLNYITFRARLFVLLVAAGAAVLAEVAGSDLESSGKDIVVIEM